MLQKLLVLCALVVASVLASDFTVSGKNILDPNGNRFVVKGVATPYGTYAGGDQTGFGTTNYNNQATDFSRIKGYGMNTVRIFIDDTDFTGVWVSRLTTTVNMARNQSLIVVLCTAYDNPSMTTSLLNYLATTYKGNPYIWIELQNEPVCTTGGGTDASTCGNWTLWQSQQQSYLTTVRNAGFTSVVIVDGVWWSWDLTQVLSYPLNDPLKKLVYSAHRYANTNVQFTSAEASACQTNWGYLPADGIATIMGEVGGSDGYISGQSSYHLQWSQGMMNWVTNWINTAGGSGVMGFNWFWSDNNTMNVVSNYQNTNVLTPWGQIFVNALPNINGGSGATTAPTTKPTTAPTTKPTTAPTTKATTAPTTKPTTAPTSKPTAKATLAPTTKPTLKPTNPPGVKEWIYDDALENGFQNWNWGTTSLTCTSPVYAGTYSMSWTMGGYSGIQLHNQNTFTISGFNAFNVYINGGSVASPTLTVSLKDPSDNDIGTWISSCVANENVWTLCSIPVSAFNVNTSLLSGLMIQSGNSGTIYLDNFYWS